MIWKFVLPSTDRKICCNCIGPNGDPTKDQFECESKLHRPNRAELCLNLRSINSTMDLLLVCRRSFNEVSPLVSKNKAYIVCSVACARKLTDCIRNEDGVFTVEYYPTTNHDYWLPPQKIDGVDEIAGLRWIPYPGYPETRILPTKTGDFLSRVTKLYCLFELNTQEFAGYRWRVAMTRRRSSGRVAKLQRVNYEEDGWQVDAEANTRARKRARRSSGAR